MIDPLDLLLIFLFGLLFTKIFLKNSRHFTLSIINTKQVHSLKSIIDAFGRNKPQQGPYFAMPQQTKLYKKDNWGKGHGWWASLGWVHAKRVHLPPQLGVWGERSKLPHRCLGQSSSANVLFGSHETHLKKLF